MRFEPSLIVTRLSIRRRRRPLAAFGWLLVAALAYVALWLAARL